MAAEAKQEIIADAERDNPGSKYKSARKKGTNRRKFKKTSRGPDRKRISWKIFLRRPSGAGSAVDLRGKRRPVKRRAI